MSGTDPVAGDQVARGRPAHPRMAEWPRGVCDLRDPRAEAILDAHLGASEFVARGPHAGDGRSHDPSFERGFRAMTAAD